jgi:putative PIG3 family NAD(P)H quinone oxidoreductase
MRAVVIREPGGPEVLELREVPEPPVPPHHLAVRVQRAAVNRADVLQRLGLYPAPPGAPRDIPGLEYQGIVETLGEGVTAHAKGDRVFGLVGGGAYAQFVVVHEREAVAIPDKLSDELAAAVPEAFVTAWDALVVRGRAQAGDRVLVHAAGSGVGTAAVQIARALGCTVIGTSRTPDKLARAQALGLDVPVVPANGKFADAVRTATGGRGVDVVVELVGGGYLAEDIACAAPRGRIVVVGLTAGAFTELDLRGLLQKRLEIIGTVLRSRPLEEKIEAAQMLAQRICPLLASGALRPVVERVLPLAEAGKAHELMSSDASFGKILLDIGA